jgi:hypothetical protein
MVEDLHLTGNKFNIALVVFYIPYIIVDVPANWLVKRVKAGIYLPALITAWGLASTFMGFTKSFGGLVAARLVLGLCEGGLLGGMIVYVAMFYPRHQMLYRIGLFYCAAPLSGAFGGLLATGLAKIKYHGYNNWPWIFLSKSNSEPWNPCEANSYSSRRDHYDAVRDSLFLHYAQYPSRSQFPHRQGENRRIAPYEDGCTRCHGR